MIKTIVAAALAVAWVAVLLVGCAGGMPGTGWFNTTPAPAPTPVYATPPAAVEAPPPVMLAPQETPAQANSNAYVVSLQTALKAKGFYSGRIDGICGPQTRGAVANYQNALNVPQHMDATCRVGDHTWSGLGMSAGDSGPHERKLQLN